MPTNSKDELEIKEDIKLLQQAREHLKNKDITFALKTIYQTLHINHYYQSTALQNSFLFFLKELFEAFELNDSPEYKEYIQFCSSTAFKAQKQQRQVLLVYLWSMVIYKIPLHYFTRWFIRNEFIAKLLRIDTFILVFVQCILTGNMNTPELLGKKDKYFYINKEYKEYTEEKLLHDFKYIVENSYRSIQDFNKAFSYSPYFDSFINKEFYRYLWTTHFQLVKNSLKKEDFGGKAYKGDLPQSLFQYKKLNRNSLDSITKEYFYLSDPEEFNDYADPIYKVKPSAFSDTMFIMSKNLEVQIRISCFTTNPENFLMWGHYADKSTGICVEYKISENIETEKSTFWKVNYEENLEMLGSWVKNDIKYWNMPAFLSVKHKNWEYENEYRYIALCEGENFKENDTPFKIQAPIKAIYLGTNIKRDTQYYALIALAKSKNIPVYQYTPHPTKMFSLVEKQVEI